MSRAKGETKKAPSGEFRVRSHPILPVLQRPEIAFTFDDREMKAYEGEVITTALFAGGVQVFGHHPRDGSPQGIFCANGQCSQCTVLVDGLPVKGCMIPVRAGMRVRSCEGLPALPKDDALPKFREIPTIETDVLVIGGGPAGINAAIELGLLGAKTLVVDATIATRAPAASRSPASSRIGSRDSPPFRSCSGRPPWGRFATSRWVLSKGATTSR
jgi:hypothetical protein